MHLTFGLLSKRGRGEIFSTLENVKDYQNYDFDFANLHKNKQIEEWTLDLELPFISLYRWLMCTLDFE